MLATGRLGLSVPMMLAGSFGMTAPAASPDPAAMPFGIHVVDAATGRGVPLVELRTVNRVSHWTDGNGWVAFREPGFMHRDVFFQVSSDGYDLPKDGFGYAGKVLRPVPGGRAEIRLVAHYSRMKDLGHRLEHGLVVYDDASESFTKVRAFPDDEPWRSPAGHPIPWREGDASYLLFTVPFPVVRARASLAALSDPTHYEAFTCLRPGSRRGAGALVERDAAGAVVWAWRADTDPVGQAEERDLVKAGQLRLQECRFALRDAEAGKPISLHGGTICYNAYRRRWILIGVEIGGSSFLGEIWYAEAEAPTGPWGRARKVVTHAKYSFYNPAQHPFFDAAGGRTVYFEGTYAATFSGNPVPTPRYDYNQIMYRLDLADPRLHVTP